MNSDFLSDRVFKVSELCVILKETISEMFYGLQVEGEVCNFRQSQARHWYFSIKDKDGSMLNCTCFAGNNWKERKPENGDLVILKGSLSFYAQGGALNFNAESIRKKGEGDLRAEIEKRRQYYKALGYFDDERKKKIPENIKTIGIVTSSEGAVIHDIMNVTRRRAPSIDLLLFPSMVQGEGAELTIAKRIRQANNFLACDVLIVARGGGSEEDLAAYSSKEVIEAIYQSEIPVISAVGHDSDFPLSDFVADLRAPTPSAAAEIVTESAYQKRLMLDKIREENLRRVKMLLSKNEVKLSKLRSDASSLIKKLSKARATVKDAEGIERILKNRLSSISYIKAGYDNAIESALSKKMMSARSKVSTLSLNLLSSIKETKAKRIKKIDDEFNTLGTAIRKKLINAQNSVQISYSVIKERTEKKLLLSKNRTEILSSRLEDLNPLSILERGYLVAESLDGKLIKSVNDIRIGEPYALKFKDGKVRVIAKEIEK